MRGKSNPLQIQILVEAPVSDPLWQDRKHRRAFWAKVAAIGLEVKDRELAAGLDKHGVPLARIASSTVKSRRSAMGKPDQGPPLMPARMLSRTRAWLRGRSSDSGATLYWSGSGRGGSWSKILGYHAGIGGTVKDAPIRDVFGISPKGIDEIARKALTWWKKYRKTIDIAPEVVFVPPPSRSAGRKPGQPSKPEKTNPTGNRVNIDLSKATWHTGSKDLIDTADYVHEFRRFGPKGSTPVNTRGGPNPKPTPMPEPNPKPPKTGVKANPKRSSKTTGSPTNPPKPASSSPQPGVARVRKKITRVIPAPGANSGKTIDERLAADQYSAQLASELSRHGKIRDANEKLTANLIDASKAYADRKKSGANQKELNRLFDEWVKAFQARETFQQKIRAKISPAIAADTSHRASWKDSLSPSLSGRIVDKYTEVKDWVESIWRSQSSVDFTVVEGAGRSFYSPTKHELSLNPSCIKEVVAHELGHAIENSDPEIRRIMVDFVARRTQGETRVNLKKKFPDRNYDPDEFGAADGWLKLFPHNPSSAYYIGKSYPSGDTECLSMGLQLLYTNPVLFATEDPEYFRLILGVLMGTIL